MIKDINKTTKRVFSKFINSEKDLIAPAHLYNTYQALNMLISDVSLVATHYLALSFDEEYLQNSSFGKPSDKWRYFLNEDLEQLTKSIKKYLHLLSYISFEDEHINIMSSFYNALSYYGFVRDDYSIGYIAPCSFLLKATVLDTSIDNNSRHLEKHIQIDLSTYEQREELRVHLLKQQSKLIKHKDVLKKYIQSRYTLSDLL